MIDQYRLDLVMNNGKVEYITCSAIWYKKFEQPTLSPFNIDCGIVLCGLRHGHIINQMISLTGLRTTSYGENSTGEFIQGFLTTKNRFLTRNESLVLVKENGQLKGDIIGGELTSEDLW